MARINQDIDPLTLAWSFGINTESKNSVHIIDFDSSKQTIVYPSSCNVVVYDILTQTQSFLQGHTNLVTTCSISSDKSTIVTGDSGAKDSALIAVWDSKSLELLAYAALEHTCGVQMLQITDDKQYIVAIVNQNISQKSPNISDQYQQSISKTASIQQYLMIFQIKAFQNDVKTQNDAISETLQAKQSIQLILSSKLSSHHELHTCVGLSTAPSSDTNYNDVNIPQQIVTNGKKTILFWQWMQDVEGNHSLQCVEMLKSDKFKIENNHSLGDLTVSTFINDLVVTGCKSGDIIIWKLQNGNKNDSNDSNKKSVNNTDKQHQRTIFKIIRLCRGSVNCIKLLNKQVFATASGAGSVRFFDLEFKAVGWLDYLGDPLVSMSFPSDVKNRLVGNVEEFQVPNMIVGTNQDQIMQINGYKQDPHKNIILSTYNNVGVTLAAHPLKPIIVVGTSNGTLEIWDYQTKQKIKSIDVMTHKEITSLVFSPNGKWLALTTCNSYLQFLETENYTEQVFKSPRSALLENGTFSFNNDYFALSQLNRILVYNNSNGKEWNNLGNYISHTKNIVSLHFGEPSGMDSQNSRQYPRLISVGKDNLLQEYNLKRSNAQYGLRLKSSTYLHTPNAIEDNDDNNIQFTCAHIIPGIRFPLSNKISNLVKQNEIETSKLLANNPGTSLVPNIDNSENKNKHKLPISSLKYQTNDDNKKKVKKNNKKGKEKVGQNGDNKNNNGNEFDEINESDNNYKTNSNTMTFDENGNSLWQTFCANSDQTESKFDENMKEWNTIEDIVLLSDDELKFHYYHCFRRGSSLIKQKYIHGSSNVNAENFNNDSQNININDTDNVNLHKSVLSSRGGAGTGDDRDDASTSGHGSASFGQTNDILDQMNFRRKLLGPAFGSPIKHINRIELPISLLNENSEVVSSDSKQNSRIQYINNKQLFGYCTYDQIIGLMKWPLTGTQNCYYATNAHPSEVKGFAVSYDNNYIITCGGYDRCINLWKINHSFINNADTAYDNDNNTETKNKMSDLEIKNQTFIKMLDPQMDNVLSNEMYNDIKNYFYFVQIKKHKEISNNAIKISNEIDCKQVETIMQALGFFLSTKDMLQIKQEISYRFGKSHSLKHARSLMNSNDANINNEKFYLPTVNLNQFIELYINYRPAYDISINVMSNVFQTLRDLEKRKSKAESSMRKQAFLMTQGTSDTTGNNGQQMQVEAQTDGADASEMEESSHAVPSAISRAFLLDVLQKKGEKMTREELLSCFEQLTGYPRKQLQRLIPEQINVDFLATKLLGLAVV